MSDALPLYAFQARAVGNVHSAWSAGASSVLLVAPTGAGKTRMGVELVNDTLARGGRVLWLAHRRELVSQAVERLRAEGEDAVEVVAATAARGTVGAPVVVASIQTLAARSERPEADLVVFDEAHHYVASEWGRVAEDYRHAKRLGLTATPERGDGSPLGDLFERLVVAAQPRELIASGQLVPCDVFAPSGELLGAVARSPVEAWQTYGRGRSAVIFVRSVVEAKALAAEIAGLGGRSVALDSYTPADERRASLGAFAAGDLDVLVNVAILTEGWDCPRADVCILAKTCGNAAQYIQIVGRVVRAFPGKSRATLVDLGGVVHAYGLPDEDRLYQLHGGRGILSRSQRRRTPPDEEWVPPPLEVTGDELVRIAAENRVNFLDLVRKGVREGRPVGWASQQFKTQYGFLPRTKSA